MCTFSESSRVRLGNAVMYIAARAKYPYKTEVLKLLFLMEERMVQKYHIPMLAIPYSVWRLGPVSVDVFEELSDGPVLLSDFVTLQFNVWSSERHPSSLEDGRVATDEGKANGQGIMVKPSREFDEDEFSDAELEVMAEVMEKYGQMNSEQLIAETHREGSLWFETAKEHGLLDDFAQKRANTSSVVIDMARFLSPADREYYEESRELHEFANKTRLEYARCEAQGLSKEETVETLKERCDLIGLEDARKMLLNTVREIYAQT